MLPWAEFDRLVEAHGADARVRRLTTKSQLVALLYAQLSGASSLREIEAGLDSHAARLYHLGAAPAGARRWPTPTRCARPAVFADLFARLAQQAHRGLRRALAETTYLIDATGVRLTAPSGWARFSAKACGAKLHVIYDAGRRPADLRRGQRRQRQRHHRRPGDADRGRRHLCLRPRLLRLRLVGEAGRRRLPHRHPLQAQHAAARASRNGPVPEAGTILSDRIGHLPARQAASRKNPFGDPVREVRVEHRDRQGAAHPVQRSRRHRPGDRRSLQAALGHRAVLPLGQADAEDQPLPRHSARTPCASRSPSP